MLIALATDAVERLPDAMFWIIASDCWHSNQSIIEQLGCRDCRARVAMGVGVASLVVMALLALVTGGFVKQSGKRSGLRGE